MEAVTAEETMALVEEAIAMVGAATAMATTFATLAVVRMAAKGVAVVLAD